MTILHIKTVSSFNELIFFTEDRSTTIISLTLCAPNIVPGPCDPEDLLDGVIFGAKYLGSTQIKTEKNPSTNARMTQAQEAVDRIKVNLN